MTAETGERAPKSITDLTDMLRDGEYLADRGLSTALYIALELGRPLLLEGEVGVGKTELAKVLASIFGRRLIRLQCYEGIDTNQALYEWDYARQMLQARVLSEQQASDELAVDRLFNTQFLLELLSDFQITIPEIGTVAAESRPLVILTSNRTRELHDALKRRCLYHWIGYPTIDEEVAIITLRSPDVPEVLARKVVEAVNRLRGMDLAKPPGVAETLDWVEALGVIGSTDLDVDTARDTLGSVIKDRDDLEEVTGGLAAVVGDV